MREIRADVRLAVLERAAQLSTTAFERLVIRLLAVMGYAAKGVRDAAQHTGKSGDGGIDGIILMDRLGLDRIYIQAKRVLLKNTLYPEDVRTFFGALQLRRARRGVLCTSGKVSGGAYAVAEEMGNVRSISGVEFAELMVEFGLGVQAENLHVPRLDETMSAPVRSRIRYAGSGTVAGSAPRHRSREPLTADQAPAPGHPCAAGYPS